MTSPFLFHTTYQEWINSPEDSFATWLANKPLKLSSAKIYLWMWKKFCRWSAENGLRLDTLDHRDLARFLNHSRQNKLHTYHYLRLIERAYLFLQALPDAPPGQSNPASQAIQQLPNKVRNDPTSFLDHTARERVQQLITIGQWSPPPLSEVAEPASADASITLPGSATTPSRPTHTAHPTSRRKATRLTGVAGEWKRQRDLALAGVFLGGGLRVQEAVNLTLSCISLDGTQLTVPHTTGNPGGDSQFSRQVLLAPFAVIALQRWLALRNPKTYGDHVFVATTKGKVLDPSSMFRRIKLLLEELMLDHIEGRSCCQTLRNSYIATLFDQELPLAQVADLAGLTEVVTAARLHRSYLDFLYAA